MTTDNKSMTILVVDDSWVIRQFIKKILSKGDYTVLIEAVDGIDAIEKVQQHRPDCIIMDILMPRMTGIEALIELKKQGINIPTFFLTADIQETTRKKCMDAGGAGFLNKPPKDDELLELITSVLTKGR